MGRQKRGSKSLDRAVKRSAALKSIDTALDLGGGMTLGAYDAQIATTTAKLGTYNATLSAADGAGNELVTAEEKLDDLTDRMLAGVASKYGRDSSEYEKAGGVRKRDRKPPRRRTPKPK